MSRALTPHVVVLGDVVLDSDVDGRTDRLCPDAPVPVVDVTSTRRSPGGAGLTAVLCASAGGQVTLVAPIADDDAGRLLTEQLRQVVTLVAVGHEGPTRRKTRVRSSGQSVVRIDEGGPGTPRDVPLDRVRSVLATADVVVVSDYGAGVTRDAGLRALVAQAAAAGPVVWDPHPRGGAPVPGVLLATPNEAEAYGVVHAAPDVAAATLRKTWQAEAVCVTAGPLGAFLASGDEGPLFAPAPSTGGDPCGAGDRFVASVAVALGRGTPVRDAVCDAVRDASAWVAAGGAEAFRRAQGDRPAAEQGSDEPGGDQRDLVALAARLRSGGRRLVATGGCFDIVHAGHVATLQAARRLGDALVVLINSDASVRRLKGAGRPVVAAQDRARVLAAFDCVDAVVVFDEDDPGRALAELRPDVWAKGGDYDGATLPEAEVVEASGGRVVLLPFLGGRSTTRILDRATAGRAAGRSRTRARSA